MNEKLTVPDELVSEICADVMVGTYGITGSLTKARMDVANRINEWLRAALAEKPAERPALTCPICSKELSRGISWCSTCEVTHAVQCVECRPCGYINEGPCELKRAERPQLSAEHSNSPSEMQMGSITSRSLELIVDRAKTKTPCASNYECLVADLMGLLTGVAEKEPPAHLTELEAYISGILHPRSAFEEQTGIRLTPPVLQAERAQDWHPENAVNVAWALISPELKTKRLETLGALYAIADDAYQAGKRAAFEKAAQHIEKLMSYSPAYDRKLLADGVRSLAVSALADSPVSGREKE